MKIFALIGLMSFTISASAKSGSTAVEVLKDVHRVVKESVTIDGIGKSREGLKCHIFLGTASYDLRIRGETNHQGEGVKLVYDGGLVITDYNPENYNNVHILKYDLTRGPLKNTVRVLLEALEVKSKYSISHKIDVTFNTKKAGSLTGTIESSLAAGELKTDLDKKEVGNCSVM